MATVKIVGTVENANSTSNSTNQPLTFASRAAFVTNYGATAALLTIVPASGSNTTLIMLANSTLQISKSANDVITSNSTTVAVSKSVVTG